MADKTGACNLSLSHLGHSKEIADVDTERSAEAAACRRFYQPALDEVMRDFPINVVTAPLALVSDLTGVDGAEWSYAYRYPSNCAKAIRIPSGIRNDNPSTRVPYKIGGDSQGDLIYTDMAEASLEYTTNDLGLDKWKPDFLMAFTLLLAFYIAPRVTAGDPFKLGERAYRAYLLSASKYKANRIGEQQDEQPPDSEYITSRN